MIGSLRRAGDGLGKGHPNRIGLECRLDAIVAGERGVGQGRTIEAIALSFWH